MNFLNWIKVLQAGNSLRDVSKWKDRQSTGTAVGVILLAIFNLALPDATIDPKIMNALNIAIVSLMGAANIYLTKATSKKVGF